MKKSFLYTACAALLGAMLLSASCKKILDQEPHNTTYTGAYFKTELDALTANAGAYAQLRQQLLRNGAWHAYADLESGLINADNDGFHNDLTSCNYIGGNVDGFYRNWQTWFRIIQQVNLSIAFVPNIPEESFSKDKKSHLIGEAYFTRALVYFYMVRLWGDVPVKLQPDLDITDVKNIPRSPADSVLDVALADVAKAESMLDWGYDEENNRAVRANKGSAYALAAHIQAWRHNYNAVDTLTAAIISRGGYNLLDSLNYGQVFVGKSMEGIFEINIDNKANEGIALIDGNGGYNIAAYPVSDPILANKHSQEWRTDVSYLNKLYPDKYYDEDLQQWIYPQGYVDRDADIRLRTFYWHPFDGNEDNNGITQYYGQITKYSNWSVITKNVDIRQSNNIPIFRYADMLLLRAEALQVLGRSAEAADLLNQVRQRAGVARWDATKDFPLDQTILEERFRELAFEGQAFFDMRRNGKVAQYNGKIPSDRIEHGGLLWPIDNSMFKDDYTLVQTPYWSGKY